jgi:hypothetical protein
MSDTPRTDQIEKLAYWFQDDMTPVCESRFVRTIERELTTAQDRIKMLENLQLKEEHLMEIEQENKRLKEQNKRQNELIDSLRIMYAKEDKP